MARAKGKRYGGEARARTCKGEGEANVIWEGKV